MSKRQAPYKHADGTGCWTVNCSRGNQTALTAAANKGDVETFLKLKAGIEAKPVERDKKLVLSHGQLVLKDKYLSGGFIKSFNTRIGHNSYYAGSWEELETLVQTHKHDFEPGTGSVDNDVILVNVPASGFFTPIIKIDDSNRHLVREEEYVRQEGEAPVITRRITGIKPPAKYVQVVCYRADVLAQDNSRTTDAEWAMIAILAQDEKRIPMHPTTMLRNTNHDKGGTYREYSQQEWDEAYSYWADHAYIEEI